MVRAVWWGAGWGIVAAVAMALFAMVAGLTYLGNGFFTPLYHIASTVIEPDAMMASMAAAMDGRSFHLALVGMLVHLGVGAAYGVLFALIARVARFRGGATVIFGAIYGVVVMLFSSFVGLPLAAAVFGGGDPIRDMPRMVGWPTFTVEHVLFGAVLGTAWWMTRRRRVRAE
ncbi:MAG: hypothetical protein WD770_10260 [Actinomycetota bacterium]